MQVSRDITQDRQKEGEDMHSSARAGMADRLAGEAMDYKEKLLPYLPNDLIGGSIPYIVGTEDEAVWNAAAQACGTEKIHYTYSADGDRVWYLACPSSSMASNPDSWCPLASALPGNSEHWDKETVYLYEQEGLSSALRWDPETGRMQVYLGASRTILPRVQSMNANFVRINHENARIVRWKNRNLYTEKLSRATIRLLIMSGLAVNFVSMLILVISLISILFTSGDLNKVKKQTDEAAMKLMENAAEVMQSDTIMHMVRIQNLLDNIAKSNGYMVRYEVANKRTEWNAIVPMALSQQAVKDTTYVENIGGRTKAYSPKAISEKGDVVNVRLYGTK